MSKGKILFASQEMSPFLELTDIAKSARHLPQKMQESGFEIRALMPRFGCINERRNRLHEVIRLSGMNIVVNDNDHPLIIKVASIPSARMQVYFLDNEDFFHRKTVFKDKTEKLHADNAERAIFFCIGVLETVKKLGWSPDVIHCQGWMTSFLPLLVKTVYNEDPLFSEAKVITSLFANDFEGDLDANLTDKMNKSGMTEGVEFYANGSNNNLLKGALMNSDAVVIRDANIDSELMDVVKSKGLPTLESIGGELNIEAFDEFYASLVVDNELETVE